MLYSDFSTGALLVMITPHSRQHKTNLSFPSKQQQAAATPTTRSLALVPAALFACQGMEVSTKIYRNTQGYRRHNGRWEARYRPQCRVELKKDKVTTAAFKGFFKGLYKYEFLE